MTRVLVLWADDHSPNLGVRVLAHGTAAIARRAWGDDVDVDFQNFGAGDSAVSFGTRSALKDVGRKSGPLKSKLGDYDVVIDSGAGDSFTDIYGLKRLSFMVNAGRLARGLGIPIVMGPQTIGPFNTRVGLAAARRSLRGARLVHARDSVSATYAESTLRRPVDALSTDVVFALPTPTRTSQRDTIISVSGLLWFSDAHGESTRYREATARLLQLLRDAGREVALIAHVWAPTQTRDDVSAIKELVAGLDWSPEVIVPQSLWEARETLASARLVIGSRMHACLNGLSVGTPAIPWAYSRKFEPLMSDLAWPFTIDLKSDDNAADATLRVVLDHDDASLKGLMDHLSTRTEQLLSTSVASLRTLEVGR